MPKLTHSLTVGRFEVTAESEAVPTDDAGPWERRVSNG